MTILDGRPNTALLVIDVQNDILATADGRDKVIANIGGPPAGQVIALTNLCWTCTSAPGRTAETVPAAQVSFALSMA
jgi:nicotinamidase-related amidase